MYVGSNAFHETSMEVDEVLNFTGFDCTGGREALVLTEKVKNIRECQLEQDNSMGV